MDNTQREVDQAWAAVGTMAAIFTGIAAGLLAMSGVAAVAEGVVAVGAIVAAVTLLRIAVTMDRGLGFFLAVIIAGLGILFRVVVAPDLGLGPWDATLVAGWIAALVGNLAITLACMDEDQRQRFSS